MYLDLLSIAPEALLFCGAVMILLLGAFLKSKLSQTSLQVLALVFVITAAIVTAGSFGTHLLSFKQLFWLSPFSSMAKVIMLVLLGFVILVSADFLTTEKKISVEFIALLMISTVGGMVMISANDFLILYLGLELQSLCFYLLAALRKHERESCEAAVKYFILGALSSGLLLFGIAMIYGFSGTTNFSALYNIYHTCGYSQVPIAVMLGFALVLATLLFKVAAVPFHNWVLDVYEGAPTIATTAFASVGKFSAGIVLIYLVQNLISSSLIGLSKILIAVALASIVIGSFGAIMQKNLKRLLAYSAVGQIGFIILGLSGFGINATQDSASAPILYLIIYSVTALGTFAFLNLLSQTSAISSISGLAKTRPLTAACVAALMFSLAGVPPFAGFFAKFYVINSALKSGFVIPSVIAILFSVVAAYYYLRVVKVMYFDEPIADGAQLIRNSYGVQLTILVTAVLNLGFVALLNPLLTLINQILR